MVLFQLGKRRYQSLVMKLLKFSEVVNYLLSDDAVSVRNQKEVDAQLPA
jgi:hypothetical protein